MRLEAVVFDFDGLIIDSEWVIYETARTAFAEHGHDLTVEAWSSIVGTNDQIEPSWWADLCTAAGVNGFERSDYDAAYLAQDRSNRDSLPLLAGVAELVDLLTVAGVPLGVASSSSREWLDRHLPRLGLASRFGAVVGADMVGGIGKPAPDVYLRACAELGADPTRSVALEDSSHGIAAARAAGMAAVAVPSRITRFQDLSGADRVVSSLTELAVADLEALVRAPSRADPR
jgi:putative hydrolase of the HAD superfamily